MNVSLRKITLQDTSNIVKWRNSDEVRKNLFTQDDLTAEMHINWFHSKVETGLCAQYIIQVLDGDIRKDIGTTFIKGIDTEKKEGEFGIFIGETDFRGKHLAECATRAILKIGFEELLLTQIYLSVFEDNIAAIKAYQNAGFHLSTQYESVVNNKKVLMMVINRDEWYYYEICKLSL